MKILVVALLIATVCRNEAFNKEEFEEYDDDEILLSDDENDESDSSRKLKENPEEGSDSSQKLKENPEEGSDSSLIKANPEDGKEFEGDIIKDGYIQELEGSANTNSKRGYLHARAIHRKWKDKTVYYQIGKFTFKFLNKHFLISKAIKHIEGKTCLKFVEAKHKNGWIEFQGGSGCSSYVGRTGHKPQPIKLSLLCGWGSTVHEILHALGFLHEQSRNDRDKYITVHMGNVKSGDKHNFEKYTHVTPHDPGYDYGSIMHYDETAFGKPKQWWKLGLPKTTITVNKEDNGGKYIIGQRNGLSDDDTNMILNFYGCKNRRRIIKISRRRSQRRRFRFRKAIRRW